MKRLSPSRTLTHRPASPERTRAGFSFVEVLFAVMILGIGFIMLAAIFPVAIQQAQTSSDETTSAAIAWNALTTIQEKLTDTELPPAGPLDARFTEALYPGVVRSFRDPQGMGVPTLRDGQDTERNMNPFRARTGPVVTFAQPKDYLWNRIKGESVVVDDRRFAWVAFVQRHIINDVPDEPAPYANIIVVVARSRETSRYGARDVTRDALTNLQPRPVLFDLTSDGAGPKVDQVVRFIGGYRDAVSEGAFLVVAHDNVSNPGGDPGPQGLLNAHVFRVGNHSYGNTWELSPETQFRPPAVGGTTVSGVSGARGFVVGRTLGGGSAFGGEAQDVAVYSMLVAVR
jgi:hypothetical protein